MIGRLTGTLLEKQPPALLVDVQGVGYELEASMNTIYLLPEVGQSVTLHTHFVVREDAQLLYGFGSCRERDLFRFLIKTNGVGPKMALAILSGMAPDEFARCVDHGDVATLTRLPGVGKKTAERLVVEMRDRLPAVLRPVGGTDAASVEGTAASTPPLLADPRADAESALLALGYKPVEASKALAKINAEGLSSEQLIKQALQLMVGRSA